MNLEMKKINKSFGANNVLTDVDFSLKAGEICALIGENGAGKSTLMNILGGVLPADSGTVEIDGKEMHFATPVESLDAGIGFIHQELNLINDLTIYENMSIRRYLAITLNEKLDLLTIVVGPMHHLNILMVPMSLSL